MLLSISTVQSFVLLSNSPLYGYTTNCLSIHTLLDFYVVSSFWLLQTKLSTLMYKSLYASVLLFGLKPRSEMAIIW